MERLGQVFHKDKKNSINGKIPVYTYERINQGDLFNEKSDLRALNYSADKKILCDPKTLKVIGFFD